MWNNYIYVLGTLETKIEKSQTEKKTSYWSQHNKVNLEIYNPQESLEESELQAEKIDSMCKNTESCFTLKTEQYIVKQERLSLKNVEYWEAKEKLRDSNRYQLKDKNKPNPLIGNIKKIESSINMINQEIQEEVEDILLIKFNPKIKKINVITHKGKIMYLSTGYRNQNKNPKKISTHNKNGISFYNDDKWNAFSLKLDKLLEPNIQGLLTFAKQSRLFDSLFFLSSQEHKLSIFDAQKEQIIFQFTTGMKITCVLESRESSSTFLYMVAENSNLVKKLKLHRNMMFCEFYVSRKNLVKQLVNERLAQLKKVKSQADEESTNFRKVVI